MPRSFNEFLSTPAGQDFCDRFTSNNEKTSNSLKSLQDGLIRLAVESNKPTYQPVLEGLMDFAVRGARLMTTFGVATRTVGATVDKSGQHSFKYSNIAVGDVFNALSAERQYHDMMFDAGRETVKTKSPSELAFTVLGLVTEAEATNACAAPDVAAKKLKDAVATAIRALQESQEADSIAIQARQHYQQTRAP